MFAATERRASKTLENRRRSLVSVDLSPVRINTWNKENDGVLVSWNNLFPGMGFVGMAWVDLIARSYQRDIL